MSARNRQRNHQCAATRTAAPAAAGQPARTGATADTTGNPRPAPGEHTRTFSARLDQVRHARRFAAVLLTGCPAADDAILCLSELAANACLHSASSQPGGTFTVRVLIHGTGEVRIGVTDNGGPWISNCDDHGRPHGLAIVARTASTWGMAGNAVTGRTAWAAFDCPHPAQPTQQQTSTRASPP